MRTLPILLSFYMLLAAAGPAAADAPAGAPTPVATATTEVKKEIPPRFYGLALDYSFWDGTGLNAVNYSNIFANLFEPAWNFGKLAFAGTRFSTMTLAGRFVLEVPIFTYDEAYVDPNGDNGRLTPCSNLTPSTNGGTVDPTQVQRCSTYRQYRVHPGDMLLTVRNPKIFEIPYTKINVNPSVTVTLPTSMESQYANLMLGLGAGLGVSREFLDGKLTFGYSLGATKMFHRYNVATVKQSDGTYADQTIANNYDYAQVAGNDLGYLSDPTRLGGAKGYNSDYGFRHTFSGSFTPTEKLSFTALYIIIDTFKDRPDCNATYNGQTIDVCANSQAVAQNSGASVQDVGHPIPDQVLWLSAGYHLLDWLEVNASYITWSPMRKPDGSWRQPFFSADYNAFTSLSLGATISIDKAAAKVF